MVGVINLDRSRLALLAGSFGLGSGSPAQIPTFGAALGVNYHF